jgi:uncharacterized repeat protein (TIGR03803 family)
VQGSDGNFYGTTGAGGATNPCPDGAAGCGTIFEITPQGTLTTLQSFNGTNGTSPQGELIQGTNGAFYGTTSYGGANNGPNGSPDGAGTIFSIIPGGTLVTLYNFCSLPGCADGSNPSAGLVLGTNGNFYGTTPGGGANACFSANCGTVFKITPAGVLTTLYTFSGGQSNPSPGYGPSTGLTLGADGNFYGTTAYGGNDLCGAGQPLYCGTVFKITPQGALTNLYNFCSQANCAYGFTPSGLVQGSDGNFYGTTVYGGGNNFCQPTDDYTCGTIFKIAPEGTFTTLHAFEATDGARPTGVVQATDGNFYGTTWNGEQTTSAQSLVSPLQVY